MERTKINSKQYLAIVMLLVTIIAFVLVGMISPLQASAKLIDCQTCGGDRIVSIQVKCGNCGGDGWEDIYRTCNKCYGAMVRPHSSDNGERHCSYHEADICITNPGFWTGCIIYYDQIPCTHAEVHQTCSSCRSKGKKWYYDDERCSICAGTGTKTQNTACNACDANGKVYVASQPKIAVNGVSYAGGSTESNAPQILINKDAKLSWNSIAGGRVTIINSTNDGIVVNAEEQTAYTITTNSDSYAEYTIKSEDKEGVAGTYGAKPQYYKIIIDKKAPVVEIFENGIKQSSHSGRDEFVFNIEPRNELKFNIIDDTTITATLDGVGYSNMTDIQTEVKTYSLKATDKSGNATVIQIICESIPPEIFIDGKGIDGGTELKPTTLKYSQDKELQFKIDDGKKVIISSENESETIITNGTNRKMIVAENNKTVTYTIVTVNNSGTAKFYYNITIDKQAPRENLDKLMRHYKVSHWWDTNSKSFGKYELAEAEAMLKEKTSYAIEYMLNNVADFTETHLLAPGEVVKVGKYYKFKSSTNDDNYVYYFDESNLNVVIKQYAVKNIDEKYHLKSGNSYGMLDDSMFASSFELDGKTIYFANGYMFKKAEKTDIITYKVNDEWLSVDTTTSLDKQVTMSGIYEVRESDELMNSTDYNVYIDLDAPKAEYTATRDDVPNPIKHVISIEDIPNGDVLKYYFGTFAFKVVDIDTNSVVQVINTIGNKKYLAGETNKILLSSGNNDITIYDRSGNSFSFVIYIVGKAPTAKFGGSANKMTVSISKGESYNQILSIKIFKNGIELTADDRGNLITTALSNYEFTKGGTFEVIINDNFGRTSSYSNTFDKDLPKAEFIGVTPPGSTNKSVQIKYDSAKYILTITKDGLPFIYSEKTQGDIATITIDGIVANGGQYIVFVSDKLDETIGRTYTFKLVKNEMSVSLIGVDNNGTTAREVYLTWSDEKYTAKYKKDNIDLGKYNHEQVLSEQGYYVVTVFDEAGNEKVFAFTVHKEITYRIYVGGKEVQNVVYTNRDVQFITNNPASTFITVMSKGSNLLGYTWGDSISAEGDYVVGIRDSLGNNKTFSFTIDKTKPIGTLRGVSHKGRTNGTVSFTWSEGTAMSALYNENAIVGQYVKDSTINNEGNYKIRLSDLSGNFTDYEFEIDRSVDYSLNIFNGGVSNIPVVIQSDEKELTIDLYKDGEVTKYKFNSEIKENGYYNFKILDKFNNYVEYGFYVLTSAVKAFSYEPPKDYVWSEVWMDGNSVNVSERNQEFDADGIYTCSVINKKSGQKFNFNVEIDTVPPVVRLIGVENGGSTDGGVTVVSDEGDIVLKVIRDNSDYNSKIGKEIKSDGNYIITAVDAAGNETRLGFVINYSLNAAGIGAIGVGGTGIGALILKILKKKKPQ